MSEKYIVKHTAVKKGWSDYYYFRRAVKGKVYTKYFKTLEEAKEYRDKFNEQFGDIESFDIPKVSSPNKFWPYNILSVIYNEQELSELDIAFVAEHIEENIAFILTNTFYKIDDKRLASIVSRWREYKTLEEIAFELGITKEAVRLLEQRIVNEMSTPIGKKILKLGFKVYELENYVSSYEKQLQDKLDWLKSIDQNLGSDIEFSTNNNLQLKIQDLYLSNRTKNCFAIAGINTVADILNYTSEDLLKIKNFGLGCLDDVNVTLSKLGFRLKQAIYNTIQVDLDENDIRRLGLTKANIKYLNKAGITNIQELIALTPFRLSKIKGIGPKASKTIIKKAKLLGYKFKGDK